MMEENNRDKYTEEGIELNYLIKLSNMSVDLEEFLHINENLAPESSSLEVKHILHSLN